MIVLIQTSIRGSDEIQLKQFVKLKLILNLFMLIIETTFER